MFTGLVEDLGRIVRADRRGDAVILEIATSAIPCDELELGESVAIDGTCLTVTSRNSRGFQVLAGPETLARTTLGGLRPGMRVNLERAMAAGGRFGGHMVSGHVDGMGEVAAKKKVGPAIDIVIKTPKDLLRYIVEKGSICVDGISLTVNRVDEYSFAVGLIPHTIEKTTLSDKAVGHKVNLEVDIVGKYVEKLVKEYVKR